ncbi:hypothetical protein HDU85_002713 [Gaertneriomyces sp. JEL0708]|nr:hypothetical protein HDU85_002713 [Gaertneriomyces sp. JEL0708]
MTSEQETDAARQQQEQTPTVEVLKPKQGAENMDASPPSEEANATVEEDENSAVEEENGAIEDGSTIEEDIPIEDAIRLYERGDELLIAENYEDAADVLSEAVAILSANYGDGAPECADALYLYGMALYKLAVQKSSVLGSSTVPEMVPEDAVADAVTSAMVAELADKPASHFVFGDEGDDNEVEEEVDTEAAVPAEDEDNDLEFAYEALSLAAKAYETLDSVDARKKLADVHLFIGHYHMESDRIEEALEEYQLALAGKEKYFTRGDRQLIEARYYCALALESIARYNEALEKIHMCIEDVKKRLESASERGASSDAKGKGKATQVQLAADQESKDLTEQLKDLDAKVEEIQSKINSVSQVLQTAFPADSSSSAALEPSTDFAAEKPTGPVMDINSLVKKRKQPSSVESVADGDEKSKKAKAE